MMVSSYDIYSIRILIPIVPYFRKRVERVVCSRRAIVTRAIILLPLSVTIDEEKEGETERLDMLVPVTVQKGL